jgi:hypothetical protein
MDDACFIYIYVSLILLKIKKIKKIKLEIARLTHYGWLMGEGQKYELRFSRGSFYIKANLEMHLNLGL